MAGESKIEKDSRISAEEWGCKLLKVKVVAENGYHDRQLLVPQALSKTRRAETIWIEFKDDGKKPEELQAVRHAELKADGFTSLWVDSYEKFMMILDRWCIKPRKDPQT